MKNPDTKTLLLESAHLRIHKSLSLHGFDAGGKWIAEAPLLDQWVQVDVSTEGSVTYQVAACTPSTKDFRHFALTLPYPGSSYYDPDEGTKIVPTDHWKFFFGFKNLEMAGSKQALVGIGTVDIADISMLPLLSSLRTAPGCNPFGWLFPNPKPADGPFPVVPESLPNSELLKFTLRPELVISPDFSLQMGIFMGQPNADSPLSPFLMVGFDPLQLTLGAEIQK